MNIQDFIYAMDIIGTSAFAVSGAMAGVQKKMDIFGVVVLGIVTSIGGGTLRDCLLGNMPPFCFKNEFYLIVGVACSVTVFFFHKRISRVAGFIAVFDAIGLGFFAAIGTSRSIEVGLGFFGSVIMGMITGAGGGIIRDVLSMEIPHIFRKEIYAVACITGSIAFFIMSKSGINTGISMITCAVIVISARLLSMRFKLNLPKPG